MLRLLLATLVAIFLPIAGCLDTDPVFTNDDDDTATDDDDTATDDDDSASDDDDSNTFADGESFTLSGSGFGAKATAAPIRYDDFESGTLGTNVEGYSYFLGGSAESAAHDYDATHVFGGSQSFFIDLPNGVYTNGSYIPDLGLEEVYFSYRVYVQDLGTGDTEDGPQVKYGRVTSGLGSDPFHGSPSINATQQGLGGEGQNIWWNNGSEDNVSFYGSSVTGGAWHRIELYMLLSDVDVRNGERYYMMDYSAGATHSTMPGGHFSDPWGEGLDPNLYEGAAIATLTSASNGSLLNNAVLPFFTRSDQLTQIWVDEVYLDSTQARVELGDQPAWYDCADRSPQPIVSWADGEISVTLNQGTLTGEAFGFVVSHAGDINELGLMGTWGD